MMAPRREAPLAGHGGANSVSEKTVMKAARGSAPAGAAAGIATVRMGAEYLHIVSFCMSFMRNHSTFSFMRPCTTCSTKVRVDETPGARGSIADHFLICYLFSRVLFFELSLSGCEPDRLVNVFTQKNFA